MKKTLFVLFVGIIFFSLTCSAADSDYYGYSYARLSYVNGDVFIQRADDLGYEEGVVNLALVQGDKIGTREGRAEIHLGKRNYLRIDRQTLLDVVELPRQGFDRIQLHLLAGDIFLRVNFLGMEKDIEVHTPDASYYVLEEGLYRLSVRENMQTELLVFEGQIEAAGEEGSLIVASDESLIAVDGFISPENQYYSSYDDSFARWNDSRDEMQARYVSTQYLPEELYEYEIELAYSGRWVYESPFGYVWIPYRTYSNWRPYNNGRWVWYPIVGWMWVSHEPWGWATYRYGRWHWRASLGWYWIPTRVWGPAWVHWYHGYDTIGWCPLSFWNRPVVIVNNIFYGQYRDSYYPVQSRALTVIHKNQLQAKFVSKVALTQESIGRLERVALSARQPEIRPVVDRNSDSARLASQALSRGRLREVQRSYAPDRTLDVRSRIESGAVPRTSSGSVSPGAIIRNSGERNVSSDAVGSRPSTRAIRSYGSALSRQSADRTSAAGRGDVAVRDRATSGSRSSVSGPDDAARTVRRFESRESAAASDRRATSSRSTVIPSRSGAASQVLRGTTTSGRSAVSSRSATTNRSSASAATTRSKASAKKAVKRYTPSQSSADLKRTSQSNQSGSSFRSNPQRYQSSSTTLRSGGRSTTAPARTIPSRSTSVRAPARSSSASSRSTAVRAPARSSSASSRSASAGSRSTSSRSVSSRVKKK